MYDTLNLTLKIKNIKYIEMSKKLVNKNEWIIC